MSSRARSSTAPPAPGSSTRRSARSRSTRRRWSRTTRPCWRRCCARSRRPPRAGTCIRSRWHRRWAPGCGSTRPRPGPCSRRLRRPRRLRAQTTTRPRPREQGATSSRRCLASALIGGRTQATRGGGRVNSEEKRAVVERLVEQIRDANALIVTDYRGLTVTETAELRRSLREAGASFRVAKNTLAKLAAEQADRPSLIEFLEGPTAIAFIADDPAPVAKKLTEAARSTRILAVKGGVMNGRTLTADEVRQLGELPPREVLLSQVVGAIAGPAQNTVGVLAAPLRDIVAGLDAYIAQKHAAENAA